MKENINNMNYKGNEDMIVSMPIQKKLSKDEEEQLLQKMSAEEREAYEYYKMVEEITPTFQGGENDE